MTPKEKAQELFDKILNEIDKTCDDYFTAKQCALIVVDEVLGFLSYESHIKYWQEVKQEIEAL